MQILPFFLIKIQLAFENCLDFDLLIQFHQKFTLNYCYDYLTLWLLCHCMMVEHQIYLISINSTFQLIINDDAWVDFYFIRGYWKKLWGCLLWENHSWDVGLIAEISSEDREMEFQLLCVKKAKNLSKDLPEKFAFLNLPKKLIKNIHIQNSNPQKTKIFQFM